MQGTKRRVPITLGNWSVLFHRSYFALQVWLVSGSLPLLDSFHSSATSGSHGHCPTDVMEGDRKLNEPIFYAQGSSGCGTYHFSNTKVQKVITYHPDPDHMECTPNNPYTSRAVTDSILNDIPVIWDLRRRSSKLTLEKSTSVVHQG
jgi:hypothetical protein